MYGHNMIIMLSPQLSYLGDKRNRFNCINHFVTLFVGLILCLMSTVLIAQTDGQKAKKSQQSGFLYGAALGIQREIYKDFDRRVVFFPIIGYSGEKLQVYGPFVSYSLIRKGIFEFLAQAKPRFAGYDESDSDVFEGMEDRKPSLDFGLGLNYEKDHWKIEVSSLHDVLDRSNGTELSTKIGKTFRVGPVFVEPAIGLSYLDSNFVGYYYGVEASEANGNRPEYDGDSAINTTLGVTFSTSVFLGGFTRFGIENDWLDSSLIDSPLTDTDTNLRIFLSFTKFFDD